MAEREEDSQGDFWQNANLPEGTQLIDLAKSLQGETYSQLNMQWLLVVAPNTLMVPDIQNQYGANALFFLDSSNGTLLRKVPIGHRGGFANTLWVHEYMFGLMDKICIGEKMQMKNIW